MARQITEIYNEMVLEKQSQIQLNALQPAIDNSQTLLNDLTSTSKVAVWRLIFFVVAVGIWSLEKIFDQHVAWIEQRAKEIQVGGLEWYRTQVLNFQYGDALEWINDKYQYAIINPANKIVKLCAVNEFNNKVLIKCAKLDGSSLAEELSEDEILSLGNYLKQVKFAGVQILIISRPADLLKISFRVYYNPLVMNSSGELILTPGTKPVEDTINLYLKNLPFNGVMSITELTDLIQNTKGVVNPVYISSEAKYGLLPYSPIQDYYNANAGHMKIDPLFPLSGTVEYIPYNG